VGHALPEGLITLEKFKDFGSIENMPLVFDMAEDQTTVVREPGMLFGLNGPGVYDAEVEAYIKPPCRWHGKGIIQPLERAAWRELPMAYIHTAHDVSIPVSEQRNMAETLQKAGRKVRTFEVESRHCPNFNSVQGVADVVNKVGYT
jgi:pimeloyl-ACP methyl ester carboxylesterase